MEIALKYWTDIATATAAIVALAVSLWSLFYAHASLALAKTQERRKAPQLSATLLSGDYTVDDISGQRTYHIQLSVSNLSDADNAIIRAELRLEYRLQDGTELTARLQPMQGEGQLPFPHRIAAHDAVAGWCRYRVVPAILSGNRIERYAVELTDTHGEVVVVIPQILSERRDAS